MRSTAFLELERDSVSTVKTEIGDLIDTRRANNEASKILDEAQQRDRCD